MSTADNKNEKLNVLVSSLVEKRQLVIPNNHVVDPDTTEKPPPLHLCFEVLEAFAENPEPYVRTNAGASSQDLFRHIYSVKGFLMASSSESIVWQQDLISLFSESELSKDKNDHEDAPPPPAAYAAIQARKQHEIEVVWGRRGRCWSRGRGRGGGGGRGRGRGGVLDDCNDNEAPLDLLSDLDIVLRIYIWQIASIATGFWRKDEKHYVGLDQDGVLVAKAVTTCFDTVCAAVSRVASRQILRDLPKLNSYGDVLDAMPIITNFACNMDAIEQSTAMAVYEESFKALQAAWKRMQQRLTPNENGRETAEVDKVPPFAFPLAILSLCAMKRRGWTPPPLLRRERPATTTAEGRGKTPMNNLLLCENFWIVLSLGLRMLDLDEQLRYFAVRFEQVIDSSAVLDILREVSAADLAQLQLKMREENNTDSDITVASVLEMFWGLSHSEGHLCQDYCLDIRSNHTIDTVSNLQPQTSQALAKLLTLIPPSEWDTVPAVAHRTEATDAKNVSELRDGQLRWRWHLGSTVNQLLEFIQKKRCRKNAYLKEGNLNLVWESARHQMYLEITLLRWRLQSIVVSTPNTASEGTTVLLCRDVVLVILSFVHDAHWLSSPKNFFKRLIV